MTIWRYVLLKFCVCSLALLFEGCRQDTDLISNKLRITTDEILFPLSDREPVSLKFRNGYFDTFVSLFPFQNCMEYDAVIEIGELSIFMKHDGWTLKNGEVDVYLGIPNSPVVTLRAINRHKKPLLIIKTNWLDGKDRQEIPLGNVIVSDEVVKIPVKFKLLSCNPPINGDQIKFKILSNWYENGRL